MLPHRYHCNDIMVDYYGVYKCKLKHYHLLFKYSKSIRGGIKQYEHININNVHQNSNKSVRLSSSSRFASNRIKKWGHSVFADDGRGKRVGLATLSRIIKYLITIGARLINAWSVTALRPLFPWTTYWRYPRLIYYSWEQLGNKIHRLVYRPRY
jgi:hypothetical protein